MIRQSNRRRDEPSPRLPREPRQSNRISVDNAADEPITLKATDGPATRHIRNANIYSVGQVVDLQCEALTGKPDTITCTVKPPENAKLLYPAVTKGKARFTALAPGQHTYAFAAKDADGQVRATTSAILLVER